ncbi:MAG: aminotransferase class I/II-fold pyridoxal phosphate-dependent enzyme [Verrucomicrobiota bacterium]|nr:aminotransferase class I/II-fold pyridoxal phosphate-dependent enzyme [Verrucomicrobiota bacterium]
MIRSFLNRKKGPVQQRCHNDDFTRLRNRYEIWYNVAEKQNGTRVTVEGKEMVMLASNEYLGLYDHPKVIEAGTKALKEWGAGTMGARSANGGRRFHLELEERLADFLGKEACHVSSAGYLSCMSSITGFAQRGDVVLVDKNMHSSVWDGIRLSMAEVERFSHNRPEHLRSLIEELDPNAAKIIAIEGIYSMEGHICDLPKFVDIAEENDGFLIMDDAHGLGVLGNHGRGTADHFNLVDRVDIITGSLSKSLGSIGGFVAGDKEAIDYLRTHSKQVIFSAALSPCQAAAAQAALQVMQDEPEWLESLWSNTRRYKRFLDDLGLDTWESETPAIPIIIGDREKAYYFWKRLKEKGVFAIFATAPGVPPGKDLVRTAISARHDDADFEIIENAIRYAADKL